MSGGEDERDPGPSDHLAKLGHEIVRDRYAVPEALGPCRHLRVAGHQDGLGGIGGPGSVEHSIISDRSCCRIWAAGTRIGRPPGCRSRGILPRDDRR
jgi:hypothetical protein